jgi:hypothetical protein
MARYGDYDPSQMLGLLNMSRFRNTQMPNLNIRGGYESGFSPQKVEMGQQLPTGNPMDYMNSHFRTNRGQAPPVPPQVGIDDDMGGFGPDSLIDYVGEAPGIRAGMPTADNTAIQQKYAGIKNDMINRNIDKIMTPTAEESKFMNLDSNSSPDLRQMAKTINVGDPESVRAFQKAAGLTVDGMFGPKSHAKLREIQGMADDYDKYKNPSLMNYAQNNSSDNESMEKTLTKNKEITDKNVSIDEIDTSAPFQMSF